MRVSKIPEYMKLIVVTAKKIIMAKANDLGNMLHRALYYYYYYLLNLV